MNVIERAATIAVDLVPTDDLRAALLPPVRALRELAGSVAATVRHWELLLEDGTSPAADAPQWPVATPPSTTSSDGSGLDGSFDDIGGAPVTALADGIDPDLADVIVAALPTTRASDDEIDHHRSGAGHGTEA